MRQFCGFISKFQFGINRYVGKEWNGNIWLIIVFTLVTMTTDISNLIGKKVKLDN